ncbi:general secretion pathway protein K [Duganella sp. CF402]|uniref:type II secretion system minor pseudopilin GspK n=1 Tax=unclassified Duganella TaxID=2636909 RepID=UPI0008CE3C98|nr:MULTISPECIES: type II secretion system minor pseudopilin GspK [unclassified Duganella]RZT05858.1 type II secretion system protein K (GspK) [Duganella sp. BK701]SEM82055.1 general secretion pathway protein K [Duganella sp. CF402]
MKLKRQQGVAVVTALLLTTLAVTIVASLFWQQQVQVRSMENQRLQLQTRWIVRGALDLSRLILNQDVSDSPNYTQLNGIWATPLEETRLDDYVERERLQGENFNATLSGRMEDAQGRFNLANLAGSQQTNADEVEVFERLLSNLRLDSSLAQATAQLVKNATPAAATPTAQATTTSQPIGLVRVEDLLAVSGFTPQAIEQLRDYVIILPVGGSKLNVNTAPAELLSALVPGLSLSDAAAMVSARKKAWYLNIGDFSGKPQVSGKPIKALWDVRSDYFLAYSRVRLDRATLDTQALLYRPGTKPLTEVKWIREY